MDGDDFELELIRARLEAARHQLFFDWERGTFANDTMCPCCLNIHSLRRDCARCGAVGWIPMLNVKPDSSYL